MSAIFGPIAMHPCPNCGQRVEGETPECAVCRKLGDRSLTRFIRLMGQATTPEERAELRRRFDAAKGRSWNAVERQLMEGGGE